MEKNTHYSHTQDHGSLIDNRYSMNASIVLIHWAPEIQAMLAILLILLYGIALESSTYREHSQVVTLMKNVITPDNTTNNKVKVKAGPSWRPLHSMAWCIIWCLCAAYTFGFKPFEHLYPSGLFLSSQLIQYIDFFLFVFGGVCLIVSLEWSMYASINTIEYGVLVIFILYGQHFLLMSTDLMSFYVSLELQSFCFVIICCLNQTHMYSLEAGMKYFLLSAFSSGFLLLGIGLIYWTTGMTHCKHLFETLYYTSINSNAMLFYVGVWLVSLTLLWKIAAAPFHLWAADVYSGAWSCVTLIISTLPKWTIFGFWIIQWHDIWNFCFPGILADFSALCLLAGSIGALGQVHFKRLLAYSSIAHIGYMLMPLSGQSAYYAATWLHLIIYMITSLALWTIVMRPLIKNNEIFMPQYIWDWNVVFKTKPMIAFMLLVCMISLAGIPPIAGFLSKWMILWYSVYDNLYILLGIALLSTLLSCIYYFSIIRVSYITRPSNWSYISRCNPFDAYVISLCVGFLCVLLYFSGPLVMLVHYWGLMV